MLNRGQVVRAIARGLNDENDRATLRRKLAAIAERAASAAGSAVCADDGAVANSTYLLLNEAVPELVELLEEMQDR